MAESVPRDPNQNPALRRFNQQTAQVLNSLLRQGFLARSPETDWTVATAPLMLAARIFGARPGYGMWGG